MRSLFGDRSREGRELDKKQKKELLQHRQAEAAERYDEMVTKALGRLTRWAFPDSQVERPSPDKWQLWHTTEDGKKYVDVAVTLEFDEDEPESFLCDKSLYMAKAELTREDLDESLRRCICSLSG